MAKKSLLPDYGVSGLAGDIKRNKITGLYLFWGEEIYLKEHYLNEVCSFLTQDDENGVRTITGKECTPQVLADAVQTLPFLCPRTVVIVRDVDILSPDAQLAASAPAILSDIPEETCLIFVCGADEPGNGKPNRKLLDLFSTVGKTVCFSRRGNDELARWVCRHFEALGKQCSLSDASYLASCTGGLMLLAIPEIEKAAAYTQGNTVTRKEIDAVITPVSESVIFSLTNAVAAGNLAEAEKQLDILISRKLKFEEAIIQLGSSMRKLYGARLALDNGRSQQEYMQAFGIRSNYAADIQFRSARAFSTERLRNACVLVSKAEQKSLLGRINPRVELDMLIFSLCRGNS